MTVTERQSNEKENQDKIIEWSVIWLKKTRNLAFSTQSGPFSWKNAKFHKVFISKNKLKKCQLAQAVYLVLIIHF